MVERPALVAGATSRAQAVNFMADSDGCILLGVPAQHRCTTAALRGGLFGVGSSGLGHEKSYYLRSQKDSQWLVWATSSLADFAVTKTFVEEAKGFQNDIGFGARRRSPQAVRCFKVYPSPKTRRRDAVSDPSPRCSASC